ncbi:MAG: HAD family hydrolase [Clostridia bacterium]|nr:HAD family hydrolase [Clostridia bacterium]
MREFDTFISDLDDTLLNEEHRLSDWTIKTLRRIQRQGVRVILASGRMAASMRPIVQQAGTSCPYIACNGAEIVDGMTHRVLYAESIPLTLAKDTLNWLEAEAVYAQIYYGDDWYYDKPGELAESYSRSSGVRGTRVPRLTGFAHGPTPKILGIAEPDRIQQLVKAGQERFGSSLSLTTSKPFFLEITSPLATKGNAVRYLAELIGLTPERTLVAGDSLNDLSMLEWTKYPITVENAREEARRIAWRIGIHAHLDGIAKLLDDLIPVTGVSTETLL